jgi:hypothetical protein
MLDELKGRLEANLEVAREAMDAAQADPWVTGSTGQAKADPGFAVAARCDEVALRLAVELRLLRTVRPGKPQDGFDVLDGGGGARTRSTIWRRGRRTTGFCLPSLAVAKELN